PALIIIDTLVRTLHGADENNEGGKNFTDNCEALAAELDCLVLAIHHKNAGRERMRGTTALEAAADVILRLERITHGHAYKCRLMVEESKDGESGLSYIVTLQRHFFGDPEHDTECASTLVVDKIEPAEPAQPTPKAKKEKQESAGLRDFMTAVGQALDWHGIEVRLPNNGPKLKAVSIELLRNVYYRKRADLD